MNHVKDLLSGYIDKALSHADKKAVEKHLSQCADCRQDLSELRDVIAKVKAFPAPALPAGFLERLEAKRNPKTAVKRAPSIFPFRVAVLALTSLAVIFVSNKVIKDLKQKEAQQTKTLAGGEVVKSEIAQAVPPQEQTPQVSDKLENFEQTAPQPAPASIPVQQEARRDIDDLKKAAASNDSLSNRFGYGAGKVETSGARDSESAEEFRKEAAAGTPNVPAIWDENRRGFIDQPQADEVDLLARKKQSVSSDLDKNKAKDAAVKVEKKALIQASADVPKPSPEQTAIDFAKNYVAKGGTLSLEQKIIQRKALEEKPLLQTPVQYWTVKKIGDQVFQVRYRIYSFEVNLAQQTIKGLDATSEKILNQ